MTKLPSYPEQRDQINEQAATLGDKARVGDVFPTLELTATSGQLVTVPDPAGDFVHLQLRRFAGCPICNLHLRSIVARHDEIAPAGSGKSSSFTRRLPSWRSTRLSCRSR